MKNLESTDNEKDTIISTEKRDELLSLFQEFVKSYLLTPEGEKHSVYYQKAREEARQNIENIKLRSNQGEDVTNDIHAKEIRDKEIRDKEIRAKDIRDKLLPYSDTPSNRKKGYWISIAPAFSSDPKIKFKAAGWRNDGWNEVSDAILTFVRLCDEHPDKLYEACKEFSDSPYSKGFQAGTLTPILNALNPDKFVLINNKTRRVLNYFTNKSYDQSLEEYPWANKTALSLIANVAEDFQSLAKKNMLNVDLFDEFSHWLVAIKDHSLSDAKYWKIAPGENAWNWDACREGGFIAIGWEEIGDISMLSRPQFKVKRDEVLKEHPDWNKVRVEQVWKFARIKEGDRIIANKGTTEVLGIGTVTGPYYFVEDVRHGHRIPVEWEDFSSRKVNKPGWRRTLIELDKEQFEDDSHNPEYTLEQCSNDTGLDESILERWKKAIDRKGQAIIYGPPGTGKTFIAEHLAKHLVGGGYGFMETVQFHSAYAYEDFIQGIRPKNREDGMLEYNLVPGRFLKFCEEADRRQGICVLIIDEINRANLARVFGELMYLLEYREKEIPLASDGNLFSIPENVRIIGTMNTADRSIALVDHALRRRFAFLRLQPEYGILKLYHEREHTEFPIEKLILVLRELNEEIGDPHYEIGISYFIRKDLSTQVEDIWTMEIEPYLEEHFFNDADKIKSYRWANVKERLSL